MITPVRTGVSVVVCCHNSVAVLPETLRKLAAQTVPPEVDWEVLVVDNASTDATAEVAREVWAESGSATPFRVVHESTPGIVSARRRGADAARYEYVVFCDDDNRLNADYVALVHAVMAADASIGVLGGKGQPASDAPLPSWFGRYQRYYAVGPQRDSTGEVTDDTGFVYGAGFVVRGSVWRSIHAGGFQSPLTGHDRGNNDVEISYLMRLAGAKIWYDKRLGFTHYLPARRLTWSYFLWLTAKSHRTGVYIAPYRYYFRSLRDHGAYVPPSRFHWLGRMRSLTPRWARHVVVVGLKGERGEGSEPQVREVRLRSELEGWLALRGDFRSICNRIDAVRRELDRRAQG